MVGAVLRSRRTSASKASWKKAGTRTPRLDWFLRKRMGRQPAPEEDSDSDEDQSALARAAAYKAAWRDTGRAKRKVKKKTEGPFRLPFPKFGCKRHTSRKKAREAATRILTPSSPEILVPCIKILRLPFSRLSKQL